MRPGRRTTSEKLEAIKAIVSGMATVDAMAQKFGVQAFGGLRCSIYRL